MKSVFDSHRHGCRAEGTPWWAETPWARSGRTLHPPDTTWWNKVPPAPSRNRRLSPHFLLRGPLRGRPAERRVNSAPSLLKQNKLCSLGPSPPGTIPLIISTIESASDRCPNFDFQGLRKSLWDKAVILLLIKGTYRTYHSIATTLIKVYNRCEQRYCDKFQIFQDFKIQEDWQLISIFL